jgi:hypothetical protein
MKLNIYVPAYACLILMCGWLGMGVEILIKTAVGATVMGFIIGAVISAALIVHDLFKKAPDATTK